MSKITIINNGEAKFFSHSEFHNVEFVTNKLCINVGEAEPKAEAPRPNAAEEAVAEEIKAVGWWKKKAMRAPCPTNCARPKPRR
ncbi:MAG: hypothetical protein Q4D56_15165 [Bacteroides sp.]|nr:hypothetical protein [Bacteroides sp.]